MNVDIVASYSTNFEESFAPLEDAGFEDVAAVAGDIIVLAVQWRVSGGAEFVSPHWGFTDDPEPEPVLLTQIGSNIGGTVDGSACFLAVYYLVVEESGTNDLFGDLGGYTFANAVAHVIRSDTAAEMEVGGQVSGFQDGDTPELTNPTLTVNSVPAHAIVLSFLAATAYSAGFYNPIENTWGNSGSVDESIQNTVHPSVRSLNSAFDDTYTPDSNVAVTWSPSTEPVMANYLSFYIAETGSAPTIDSLPDPLRPGQTYSAATTGLSSISAEDSSFGGIPLAAADAPTGDGDITIQGWVHGDEYPQCPDTYDVILGDGDASATVSRTMALPIDPNSETDSPYVYEDMEDVDTSENGLGKDPAIVDGVRIYQPDLGPGSMNARGQFSNVPYGTYTFWMRDLEGVMYTFDLVLSDSTIGGDTTPDPFEFEAQTGVALGATVESNEITVTGIDSPSPISVTGGQYSIDGGAYTSSPGTVVAGNTIKVKRAASASASTTVSVVLTIGGVSGTFSVTTIASSSTPNKFSFAPVNGAATSTPYTSNAVEITGITEEVAVSIVGGQYSKNGGAYTSSPGTAIEGDEFTVRLTSGPNARDSINSTLTVGGVSATYSVRNAMAGSGSGSTFIRFIGQR